MKECKLPKIFEIDYLISTELTEDDLHCLFDLSSLDYSLIVAQYRYLDEFTHPKKIIEDCRKDNSWLKKKHFHTLKEREKFTNKLELAIKNIYQYSDFLAKRWVADWMFHYGFNIKQNK